MKRGLQGRFVKQTTAGDHTKKDGIRKLRPRFTFILNQYEYMGQDGGVLSLDYWLPSSTLG